VRVCVCICVYVSGQNGFTAFGVNAKYFLEIYVKTRSTAAAAEIFAGRKKQIKRKTENDLDFVSYIYIYMHVRYNIRLDITSLAV